MYSSAVESLPDTQEVTGDGTWLTTDPLAQNAWIDRRNVELGYHLKPIVRMLKRWNTEHNSRLGSWHLEVIVATVFRSLGSNYRDAVAKFFDWAQSRLDVEDPDGYGGNLAALLTSTQRSAIKQALESARERASRASQAEASGNHAEAIRLWRIIFGSEFPGYG